MEILTILAATSVLSMAAKVLYVAVGLGLVIFFHELGHFAVAKWCDVNVERFSIGFGPILWSRKWGETEYALSAIPFGGYVKMLGQDDIDPSQLTSEEIAEDPRSYSAKPVWQRMLIISAGVIMNVITGLLFYASAFWLGVEASPPVVGSVEVGMPAWVAGIERGDRIEEINGDKVSTFTDIQRGVALSRGAVSLQGQHRDGSRFSLTVYPDTSGTRRVIGIEPTLGLNLIEPRDDGPGPVAPGTPAAEADPPFQPGDRIEQVQGTPVESFAHLQDLIAQYRAERIAFQVRRKTGETEVVHVDPNHFRTLGLWMDLEKIAAVRKGSPAERAGLKVGDKIASINDRDVGTEIHPLTLPDLLADLHGQEVKIVVTREEPGGGKETITAHLVPENRPGWIERPGRPNAPMSIAAIGIAVHVTANVLKVEPDSPAAKAGLHEGVRVRKMRLTRPADVPEDGFEERTIEISFDEEKKNWPYAFWTMQQAPLRTITLVVSDEGTIKEYELTAQPRADWFVPTRGIRLDLLTELQKASGPVEAVAMGLTHTKNSMLQIYLMLRNLLGGLLSVKELHGPVGIARVAYMVAEQGLAELLLFLGFLSVNLAVLNFLPIPVLDGGHMLFLIWEGITRRRPNERILVTATYIGLAFVLGLMLFVIYLDVARLTSH